MKIKAFIQNQVILPRLKERSVLVVYDPTKRYRKLCLELAGDKRKVIDAGESSIESREQALATLQAMGEPNSPIELLVYVPAAAAVDDQAKQIDPFAIYGVCGSVFPDGDGDEYQSICLKAKAQYATEIRRIFAENPNPSFDVIDAVGGGSGWPHLQAALQGESARDLLFLLLAATDAHKEALKANDAWVAEAKDLFKSCLGLKLMTRGKTWSAVADELWRFVLFSEFVFDLPEELPAALANVPRAGSESKPIVEDVCDRLRNDQRTQTTYIERAEQIERDLKLPDACKDIRDLGVRDTFSFEERTFFRQAAEALEREDLDRVREIMKRSSIWAGRGEIQQQWFVLKAAADLIESCGDAERNLAERGRTQESLIEYYLASLRDVDRRQREFERAASDCVEAQAMLHDAIARARKFYRSLIEKVQGLFVKHLESSGWPPAGMLANAEVFDRLVAPKLQESGRRVAYILVDALRYELGVVLENLLREDSKVEMQAAFAQLPSITLVGMASLLPSAAQKLRFKKKDNEFILTYDDKPLTDVTKRMEVLRERYGERFAETTLKSFIKPSFKFADTVDLLVIRTASIDAQLESAPETTLAIIADTLKRIRVAIHKLRDNGFADAIIVTDHGFFLNAHAEAGDIGAKPAGTWIGLHDRCLLGAGKADSRNYVLPAEQLGIRGDFAQVAGPRGMVAYCAGELYFHGGASLQEALVPVITVELGAARTKEKTQVTVAMTYRRGAKKITTRMPVVDVTASSSDMFLVGSEIQILLEAHDKQGNVVGEARTGESVNPATGTLTLRVGESAQIPLRMSLEFQGKFTVKALDPTTLASHATLELETDYTV